MKKSDSFSTFDDGLLYQFPLGQYEHLTYYCRTSTPTMDTCNVKLFKLQQMMSESDEKKNKQWAPPLSWNETILFARFGYHRYFKVNAEVNSMLFTRQEENQWYKFDYLFSWEDHIVSVFVNGRLNTTQPFYMGQDPFASGQGYKEIFTGVDSLVLYTLTPGGVSEFADVKLCGKGKCLGYDTLENGAAMRLRSGRLQVLVATIIIYISLFNIDSLDKF